MLKTPERAQESPHTPAPLADTNPQRTRIVIFLVFLLSVVVLEIIVHSGQKRLPAPSPEPAPPLAQVDSQPLAAADLLALHSALEHSNGAPAVTASPRQPEYNERDVRAE